jgi:hypothetical protein
MIRFSVLLSFFWGCLVPMAAAQTAGPEKGWLIIQGGGTVSKEIEKRFVKLSGGPDANSC